VTDFYERNHLVRPLANVSSRSELLDNRSREYLLRNAFHQMRNMRKWRGSILWSWIGAVTGHGSGYSMQICKELGWDPDMTITPNARLPDRVVVQPERDLPPEVSSRYPLDVMNEADPDECAECLAHPAGVCNEHVIHEPPF
jgi:hypothetical protein